MFMEGLIIFFNLVYDVVCCSSLKETVNLFENKQPLIMIVKSEYLLWTLLISV